MKLVVKFGLVYADVSTPYAHPDKERQIEISAPAEAFWPMVDAFADKLPEVVEAMVLEFEKDEEAVNE
jgi:hypothetical protein